MAYFTFAELTALIPEEWLTQSLDDDESGDADLFAEVQASAENAVNAPLSLRYATPVAVTPLIKRAALLIAAEMCYARRNQKDRFPYAEELNGRQGQKGGLRYLLEQIGAGEMQLTPTTGGLNPSGGIVADPSRTNSGKIAF